MEFFTTNFFFVSSRNFLLFHRNRKKQKKSFFFFEEFISEGKKTNKKLFCAPIFEKNILHQFIEKKNGSSKKHGRAKKNSEGLNTKKAFQKMT